MSRIETSIRKWSPMVHSPGTAWGRTDSVDTTRLTDGVSKEEGCGTAEFHAATKITNVIVDPNKAVE